jgi:DNA-binding beta-propeller fold protein YncE
MRTHFSPAPGDRVAAGFTAAVAVTVSMAAVLVVALTVALALTVAVVVAVVAPAPPAGASAGAIRASVPPPPCSTAAAPAPNLTGVTPAFVTTPGSEPFGVAISPNSQDAFVGEAGGPLAVYSLASIAPKLVRADSAGVSSLLGLALSRDGRYLVAAQGEGDANGALVFNAVRLTAGGPAPSAGPVATLTSRGSGSIEAAVSPDGRYAFVSMEDSSDLAVFNLAQALKGGFRTSDLVGYVPLGNAPVGIAIAPDGRYLYVTSEVAQGSSPQNEEGTLTTIDLATAERAPAHAVVSTVPAGCNPVRVVATASSVFVTARASDAVLEFSARDLVTDPEAALQDDMSVGEAPVGLALVDHNRTLVIADSNRFGASGARADLAVVTVATGGRLALAGYVASGMFPRDMAASPNGRLLLVCNFDSNQLESVDTAQLP